MTSAADQELGALRIELLRARAAVERMQLVQQLDSIDGRTRAVRGVARVVLGQRRPSNRVPTLAATAIGFARRQSWLLPAVASVAARLLRIRALRWLLLAGAAGATVWWLAQRTSAPRGRASAEDMSAENARDDISDADTSRPPDR